MPLDTTGATDDVAAELKAMSAAWEKAAGEVKQFAEKANEEIKANKQLSAETREAADKGLLEMNQLSARVQEIEQKAARRGMPADGQHVVRKTLGELIIENADVKSRLLSGAKSGRVQFPIETKAILSGTASWGSTTSVNNSLVAADRQALVPLPMRPLTVRDLMAPGQTSSNAIEYAVQVTRTNSAAVVAEGAAKPYSNYAWDLRSFPVRTIAHMIKASRQILDDAPGLQSIIDSEMRYGLAFAEEAQLLYGDGTGQNLLGVVPQATAYSAPFAITTPTAMDVLRLAMLQASLALLPVTGIVLNPTDWAKVETTKDANGRYIVGDPQGTIVPRMWGLPVAPSIALTAGTFVVGAFKQAAQIFDRMEVEVMISTENVDDFEKNLISVRCEERLAFVVKRPAAFIAGSLP